MRKKIGKRPNAEKDPFAVLLAQLSGIKPRAPKQLQAEQHWSKANFDSVIKPVFEERWESSGKARKQRAAFRAQVTRELFQALGSEVQKQHKRNAKKEHEEALKAWKEAMNSAPSTKPQDRQE